jgi:hypothetical protein
MGTMAHPYPRHFPLPSLRCVAMRSLLVVVVVSRRVVAAFGDNE